MERELYNLKTKILRSKHISDQLREELANDVFEIEKLVKEEKQGKNTDNAYKKCAECGKMKMVGVQCKDPRTGQCDKDPRYIKDFIALDVTQQRVANDVFEIEKLVNRFNYGHRKGI